MHFLSSYRYKQQHNMTTLPLEFQGKGEVSEFYYKQIKREGNIAIYKQTYGPEENDRVWYEVVVIREQNESVRVLDGKEIHFEEKELYPTSEQWGRFGFTFNKLGSAEQKFRNLCNRYNAVQSNG